MTNEEQEGEKYFEHDFTDDPHGVTFEDTQPRDAYLDVLMSQYVGFEDDSMDGAVGLTFTAKGQIISGVVISRARWGALFLESLTAADSGTGTLFAEVETFLGERDAKQRRQREDEKLPQPARRFIHMKDVLINPGSSSLEVPLWRGRLDAIDGWSMGSWNKRKAE